MATEKVTVELIDVDGSFARFLKAAPKEMRAALSEAVGKTTFALAQRMKAQAPIGPDAPHMREAIEAQMPKRNSLMGRAGVFDNDTEAHVALYNEYRPNVQPFMRPAARDEDSDFKVRATKALQQAERALSGGAGNL